MMYEIVRREIYIFSRLGMHACLSAPTDVSVFTMSSNWLEACVTICY